MIRWLSPLLCLALVPPARGEAGPDPADPSAEVVVLRRCAIDYERSSNLGSPLNGVVQECLVETGDRVRAGQVLGRLQDEDLRAEVRLRELEAGSDIEIRLGEAKRAQALGKARRTGSLLRRNAASQEEFNLHTMEAEAAALEVEEARHRRQIAEVQLRLARAQLRSREFVSPHDGVVVSILRKPGEAATPHDPIFRIVDVDHLLVTGQADVVESWRMRPGQPVRIVPEVAGANLAVEREVFTGRVAFVDTHVDPMTQTVKVVAKIENRSRLLRAGLEARMEILPEPVPAAPAPASAGLTRPPRSTAPGARASAVTGTGR